MKRKISKYNSSISTGSTGTKVNFEWTITVFYEKGTLESTLIKGQALDLYNSLLLTLSLGGNYYDDEDGTLTSNL